MPQQGVIFTEEAERRISRAVRWVEANQKRLTAPRTRRRPPGALCWLYGQVKTTWSPAQAQVNQIELYPCDVDNSTIEPSLSESITVTVYVCLPKDSTPVNLENVLVAGAMVAYLPFKDEDGIEGVLVSLFASAGQLFPVKVYKTGGATGDKTTKCAYVYTVKALDETTELGTSMTPAKPRQTVGYYTAPSDGDYGLGFYDATGTFVLFDANEIPDAEACISP